MDGEPPPSRGYFVAIASRPRCASGAALRLSRKALRASKDETSFALIRTSGCATSPTIIPGYLQFAPRLPDFISATYQAAIVAAVAVFILLGVFAALTLPDRESGFWIAISLTVIVAGAAYFVVQQIEERWRANYHDELSEV
jgi:hypothetical protein